MLFRSVERSHYDPITHFTWLFSRTGTECATTSTDGRVLWWDTKKLDEGPTGELLIKEHTGEDDPVVGGTVLEYNSEAGVLILKMF